VKTNAYCSFTEAYNAQKDETVYTIIDLKNNIKGADNYGGWCDYKDEEEIKQLLDELESGEVEISHRNRCDYNLDIERTLNQK
jgi:hypothetical protein